MSDEYGVSSSSTLTLAVTGVSTPLHGTATSHPDGTITYTPAANYDGADSFTYTISDGHGGTATGTVSVTITAVNDAPTASDQAATTDEDTAKVITLSATDVEGSPLTYAIVSGPAHGTLSGTAPALTYTPAANYNGPDSFTFKANDGSLDSNVATVTIAVTAVNDAPVANADTLSATEDTQVIFNAVQLLGNDTDVDGDPLSIASVTSGAGGTAVLNANGTVTFTPNANFNGAASFTYKAFDGTVQSNSATVTVNVTKAASTIAWPAPVDIVYGTALGGTLGHLTQVVGPYAVPTQGARLHITLRDQRSFYKRLTPTFKP